MATHQNRNRLLLATVGLVVVGAILAGVVIQSRPETNDQAAESVTSTTSLSGSTTPSMAPTTPSVSSNGPIPPEQVTVQPEVQVTIDAGDIAPVILKLAVTPVGTDEERIEQVRAARNELLAQLPAGSWTGTDNVGTLPYIALSLDAAGFEATRNSGVVSMNSCLSLLRVLNRPQQLARVLLTPPPRWVLPLLGPQDGRVRVRQLRSSIPAFRPIIPISCGDQRKRRLPKPASVPHAHPVQ